MECKHDRIVQVLRIPTATIEKCSACGEIFDTTTDTQAAAREREMSRPSRWFTIGKQP